jgi:hypothetical protein
MKKVFFIAIFFISFFSGVTAAERSSVVLRSRGKSLDHIGSDGSLRPSKVTISNLPARRSSQEDGMYRSPRDKSKPSQRELLKLKKEIELQIQDTINGVSIDK